MNRSMSLFLAVCLGTGPAATIVRADAAADKVVDKAIRAHGGETALARTKTMIRTESGTLNFNGGEIAFSSELTADLPDRYRLEVELGPMKLRQIAIVTRARGWQVTSGNTLEMSRETHHEAVEEGYALYLTSLAPLRREKGIELTTVRDAKVAGKPAAGVKVKLKGHDDVQLFFDKETGLLVRMARSTPFGGLTAEKEYLFSEYKEVEGVKMPMKRQEFIAGQKYMDGKVSSFRFPDRVDEKNFAKPN
jgi:hypothetical protein